jgi:hypothetical protein
MVSQRLFTLVIVQHLGIIGISDAVVWLLPERGSISRSRETDRFQYLIDNASDSVRMHHVEAPLRISTLPSGAMLSKES